MLRSLGRIREELEALLEQSALDAPACIQLQDALVLMTQLMSRPRWWHPNAGPNGSLLLKRIFLTQESGNAAGCLIGGNQRIKLNGSGPCSRAAIGGWWSGCNQLGQCRLGDPHRPELLGIGARQSWNCRNARLTRFEPGGVSRNESFRVFGPLVDFTVTIKLLGWR